MKKIILTQADAQGCWHLSLLYDYFDDEKESFPWMKRAAELGHAGAQYSLGISYLLKSRRVALAWIKKSALQRNAWAANHIGNGYYFGSDDLPINKKQAVHWLRISSEEGYPPSQHLLGIMLKNGEGTPQDYPAALDWFRRAAKEDFPGSALEVGNLYFEGLGVEKNRRAAIRWWQKAAKQGDAKAKRVLKRYSIQPKPPKR